MAYSLPLLTGLRSFEASARHLSFARAAVELGMTPAAVSQQIRALETHLGVKLFERRARGVLLTTLGRAYFPSVQKSLDELTISTTGLFGGTARRTLVVRSAVSFAALCLAPRLGTFRRQHPDIQIRLYASIWSDDLNDGRIDLDIRYGHGQWDGCDAERLSDPVSVPICPPGSGFGADCGKDLFDIVRRHPVHVIGYENMWTKMARAHGWPDGTIDTGTFVDTSLAAIEMVASGEGAAMISRDLTLYPAARGRIVVAPGLELRHDQSHYLLTPRDGRARSPDALLFRDWLLQEFSPGQAAPADAPTRVGLSGGFDS